MQSENTLIVCWDFPPYSGIGGRRWAKISKSLLKLGHQVSVIAATPEGDLKKNAWLTAEELSKIKLYHCSKNFLTGWLNDYDSSLSFIKVRIAKFLLSLFFNGTIFDKAIGVRDNFLALTSDVIKSDKIKTIFVTGTPFNLLYYVAQLKKEFPDIKIIADYRDPWITAQNYGMANLSVKKMDFELEKQNYVFEHVDFVTAPNAFMLAEIRESYTGKSDKLAKFIVLPHAFDPDDVVKSNDENSRGKNIKIIYGGTLYLGIEKYLKFLNDSLNFITKNTNPGSVELDFYSYQTDKGHIFKGKESYVKFSGSIGNKIFDEVRSSDFILILLAEHNKNYLTSKFFEFLPYQKPYLYIGPEGAVSKKIIDEGLGYFLKNVEDLYNIVMEKERLKPSVKLIEKYSFDFVTKELLQAIRD